ncbi:MAG TPA: D-alanyl-D-alanine carboxypeptidase [Candidatus Blautia intestinavium]|nr:D-alanyl-D-alanine carboxypeptidase [Candidatus Blautia intestinavium]
MAAVMVFALPSSAQAAEEGSYQGAPVVTATPTPNPHTQYYNQAPDTDSIKEWPAGPKIEGESAILMDMTTGAVLYSKNADKAQYPASITKIMTALLACEHLDMNGKIVMSESAAYGISVSDSSSIYADTGEEFTMEQALMAVMLQSANEMTLALAENTSGSVKKFVELMNQKARQLGCTNTHFNNPHGLPDEMHYTTAADMAKIARAAFYNPTFRRYVTRGYYEIPPTNKFGETRYLLNHHKMMEGQQYAYDGVLGGKTGYTEAAGNTLVTYARRGNLYLVAVVMQSVNGAYSDTAALLDYGFNNFTRQAVRSGAEDISASYLPAEKYIRKDYRNSVLFYSLKMPSVTLPNGINVDRLSSSRKIKKNPAGLPLLETTYVFNGHQVGTARHYQKTLFSDLLF